MTSPLARARDACRLDPLVAAVAALAFGVYANSLGNGFVYDDFSQVVENPWLRDVRHVADMFSRGAWQFMGAPSNYYRPLMHLSYFGTYQVFGPAPWAFHLVNVGLHVATSVLVFFLVRRLLDGARWPSFAAAAVFAVHPLHTEAVDWIASLPDLSATTFVLCSLLLYLRARDSGRRWPAAGSILCFGAGLLAKEPALGMLGALAALELAVPSPRAWRERVGLLAAFGGVTVAYLLVRAAVVDTVPVIRHADLTASTLALSSVALLAQYVVALIAPVDLNFFHVLHPTRTAAEALPAIAVVLGATAGCALVVRRSRPALVGVALFLVPLLPALWIPRLGENPFAERYVYLPSVGFVIVLAAAIRGVRPRPIAWAALATACTVLAAGTVLRNRVWENDLTLWTDTAQRSPDSAQAWIQLGKPHMESGRYGEALECLRRALALRPGDAMILTNMGLAYLGLGAVDDAIANMRSAVAIRGDIPGFYRNLALAYDARGDLGVAAQLRDTADRMEARAQ